MCKYRFRQRVSEFTSRGEKRVKILVNSCKRWADKIGMRVSRKSCAERSWEGGSMQLAISEEQLACK